MLLKVDIILFYAQCLTKGVTMFSQLDRQNKKIAELEETIRKLESLKTIAESQNMDLIRKLKEAERGNRGGTLKRRGEESKDTTPVTAVSKGGSTLKRKSEETRDSPAAVSVGC